MNYFIGSTERRPGECDGILHEIKEKDSLYKISRMYRVSLEDILERNPSVDVYNLTIGDTLCIPVRDQSHIVQPGETLDQILKQFRLSYRDFRRANPQLPDFPLEENSVIYIPENVVSGRMDGGSAG